MPGYEFAREVVALVQGFVRGQAGDLVMGSPSGAFAEYCTVAEADVIAVPAGIEPESAAALPTGLLTEQAPCAEAASRPASRC
ncbi:zinc-binding alcohol dehydrogenase family protein [Brachybacterium squillarum]|uniref:zinc-binding alcohol dehydrogenase family protein n=1 Tax=Brachybacterium squillarum TaxID=661979 RepID=UPI000262971E|nr:zinc-binding alcohol dehydrogenase family protein [Brachybacterium squillarum]